MKLKGKVAIVTGGARDIGREVSVQLAKEGAKVVINYFGSETEANETKKLIIDAGGEAFAVKADMTKWNEVQSMIDQTKKTFGEQIHILVNVVGGLFGRKTIEEQDEAWYDLVMDVNLKSIFFTTKATIGSMPAGSSIINFSSQAGRDGGGGGASLYATAKGAVMTYTRAMAKELGPKGIRANVVAPGPIETDFNNAAIRSNPQMKERLSSLSPLGRVGNADDIAGVVAFLCTDEAYWINGQRIEVSGGING